MPIDPDVQTELNNINSTLTTIQTNISTIQADILEIKDTLENHEERISNNENALISFFGNLANGIANSFPEENQSFAPFEVD